MTARGKGAAKFTEIVRDIAEMAPKAAELMEAPPAPLVSEDADDQETPESLFGPLHDEFQFTLDVAASHQNRKAFRYCTVDGTFYGEGRQSCGDDGLRYPWDGERVWCNPPFTLVRPWVERAWSQDAEVVVMLLPNNRAEQQFWQQFIEPYRDRAGSILTTRNVPKRRAFAARVGGELVVRKSPPFGLVLVIWDRRRPKLYPAGTPLHT